MPMVSRFEQASATWAPRIRALMDQVVGDESPAGSSLAGMAGYHLDTGGKRLRALLPLLTAEALGRDPSFLVPFSAACEMLHNATLVHDDLQDGDALRRGQATVWKHYGAARAINLGDAMFYWALLLLQRLEGSAVLRELASRRLLRATLQVIDGQEQEFLLKASPAPTPADYFRMVEGKTSGLFSLPMAGAAELSGAPPPVVQALERAAGHLGVLFQVQDDLLDLWGDKGRQDRGSDIGEGKRSLLVIHTFAHAAPSDAARLRHVLDLPRHDTTAADVTWTADLMLACGARDHALMEVYHRQQAAVAALRAEGAAALARLVAEMSERFLDPIRPLLDEALAGE